MPTLTHCAITVSHSQPEACTVALVDQQNNRLTMFSKFMRALNAHGLRYPDTHACSGAFFGDLMTLLCAIS